MELFLNGVLALIILILGVVSVRWKSPQPPFMKYKIVPARLDFYITVTGAWVMFVLSSMMHTHALRYDMSPESIGFFSKFGTFVAVHIYLKYTMIRPSHVGLYTFPTAMNMLAIMAQLKALNESSILCFAIAKVSRLFFVALASSKQMGLWSYVTLLALIYVLFHSPATELPSYVGMGWLALFVLSDIMTSISQEKIFRRFQVTPGMMMYYINGIMSVVYFINIVFEDKHQVYKNYSEHAILLILYAVNTAAFQYFHLKLIKTYGAVMFTFVCVCKFIFFSLIEQIQDGPGLEMYDYFILTWMLLVLLYCPVEPNPLAPRSVSLSLPLSTNEPDQ